MASVQEKSRVLVEGNLSEFIIKKCKGAICKETVFPVKCKLELPATSSDGDVRHVSIHYSTNGASLGKRGLSRSLVNLLTAFPTSKFPS